MIPSNPSVNSLGNELDGSESNTKNPSFDLIVNLQSPFEHPINKYLFPMASIPFGY